VPDAADVVAVPVDGYRAAVRADDPAFTRADAVFETLLVRDGVVCLPAEHLARLARSAAQARLLMPAASQWLAAAEAALGQWQAGGEAVLRLLLGRDSLAFVTVSAVPDRIATVRRSGVSALTLLRPPAPLITAKSLSYAVNSAALRHAQRRGCDDAIFVDDNGAVLEGPRSAVVIAISDDDAKPVLLSPDSTNILPSTTLRALFEMAVARGIDCRYGPFMITDIVAAQGVWLLSSVTLATRVHTLDGAALAPAPLDPTLRALVDDAVAGRF
jgi:4-amino-4-deoxychorismate lyase